eukprot:TRINITY_DN1256_c0_g1_i1.p1 TRINITY_DN1256_c0_g1~~TRINITY_DN1256_c0_g1_i1.p1  ORF type:complete len:434 (+),score=63.19 TRINITY_DN1256_c0_g1_i1:302-1603(+)
MRITGPRDTRNCSIRLTLFMCGGYQDYRYIEHLLAMGGELAVHTMSHATSLYTTRLEWDREVEASASCHALLARHDRSKVSGFRAPFLSLNVGALQAVFSKGLEYDSSVVAHADPAFGWPWPFTLHHGLPEQMAARDASDTAIPAYVPALSSVLATLLFCALAQLTSPSAAHARFILALAAAASSAAVVSLAALGGDSAPAASPRVRTAAICAVFVLLLLFAVLARTRGLAGCRALVLPAALAAASAVLLSGAAVAAASARASAVAEVASRGLLNVSLPLWEVPLYSLNPGARIEYAPVMDPDCDFDDDDLLRIYKENFLAHYTTNRAPFGIYWHALNIYRCPSTIRVLQQFLEFAFSHEHVLYATAHDVLEWMRHPVPADEFRGFPCPIIPLVVDYDTCVDGNATAHTCAGMVTTCYELCPAQYASGGPCLA